MVILLDDDMADVDITKALISDLKVTCDGTELKVDDTGTIPYDNGVVYIFFDCYDMEKYSSETDFTDAESYNFSEKNVIEVSFTISQTTKK